MSRSRSLLMLLAIPFATACAGGTQNEGAGSLSGGYSAGSPGGGMTDGEEPEGSDTDPYPTANPMPAEGSGDGGTDGWTSGQGDDGAPECCEVAPTPGCGSEVTEACVCTLMPACCQQVWSADCVDLAVECGDPYCVEGGSDDGDMGTTGGDPVELPCDDAFDFFPLHPAPGVGFDGMFSDPNGLTWVHMRAEGPGGVTIDGSWVGVEGGSPFTWTWSFAGMAAGTWTFTFTHRESEGGPELVHGTCQKQF
ncbi:MAG: hypothetical protein AAF799_17745 [Myxococcota bacterium]